MYFCLIIYSVLCIFSSINIHFLHDFQSIGADLPILQNLPQNIDPRAVKNMHTKMLFSDFSIIFSFHFPQFSPSIKACDAFPMQKALPQPAGLLLF